MWMLEVIGTGVEGGKKINVQAGFVEVFNASPLKLQLEADLSQGGVGKPLDSESQLAFASKRAASELTQAKLLI